MAETAYCRTFEVNVNVSGYNRNGLCSCLNCDMDKCIKSECECWDRVRHCVQCMNYVGKGK